MVKSGSEICKCEFFKGFNWDELWAGSMIAPYQPRPIPLEAGMEYRCMKMAEQLNAENKESEGMVQDKLVANYLNSTIATRCVGMPRYNIISLRLITNTYAPHTHTYTHIHTSFNTRISAAQAKVQRQVKTVREEEDGVEEDEDGFDVNMAPAEKARIMNR